MLYDLHENDLPPGLTQSYMVFGAAHIDQCMNEVSELLQESNIAVVKCRCYNGSSQFE